jgi:hypothetical protein
MAAQTPQAPMALTRVEFRAYDFLIEYKAKGPAAMPGLSQLNEL